MTTSEIHELPPLPEPLDTVGLSDVSSDQLESAVALLQAAETKTRAAMAPYDNQLKEIKSRLAEIATENRRRERTAQIEQRKTVRQQAASGELPSLEHALSDPDAGIGDDRQLATLRTFLRTGGEIGLGFATKPGSISFSNGREQKQATTWGQARGLYAAGWEPGTAALPGVRVHLAGTRVEKVVSASEIAIDQDSGGTKSQ